MAQNATSIQPDRATGRIVDSPLSEDIHCRVRWAYDYWNAKRGARPWPLREDIDPVDFPRDALPTVYILERLESEDDYLVRLGGNVYRQIYGRETTGLRVSQMIPREGDGAAIHDEFATALSTGRPVLHIGRLGWHKQGAHLSFQRILLPVSSAGPRCDILVGVAVLFGLDGAVRY